MKPRRAPVPGWRGGEGWGWIWGPDDQAGSLNAITAESVLEALNGVSSGRIFDLGLTVNRKSFVAPVHPGTEVVAFRTPRGLQRDPELSFSGDAGGVGFNTSMITISDHTGTQIDALCHATFGTDQHWYNGYPFGKWAGDFGPERAGAERIRPIVATCVLIDVAGHAGVPALSPGFPIGPDLLAGALSRQAVDIAPGEVVLIRTGAARHWDGGEHARDAFRGHDTAGLTLAGARWLVEEKGALLIASDTSTVEVVPPVDGDNVSPVHKYLLVDQGVHMGELHCLEELAEAGIHRACYIALTPKIGGTTAGFALRPIAVI